MTAYVCACLHICVRVCKGEKERVTLYRRLQYSRTSLFYEMLFLINTLMGTDKVLDYQVGLVTPVDRLGMTRAVIE